MQCRKFETMFDVREALRMAL